MWSKTRGKWTHYIPINEDKLILEVFVLIFLHSVILYYFFISGGIICLFCSFVFTLQLFKSEYSLP